jgi:anthranilate synthase component 1
MVSLQPDFATFESLAARGNLVPVSATFTADYETPVSAYQKLMAGGGCSFLLESAEKSDQIGRFSFLGSNPRFVFTARGREIELRTREAKVQTYTLADGVDPLTELERLMEPYRPVELPGMPPFIGGAVGYLAYDMVRFFEPTVPGSSRDELGLPDMVFMLADTVVVFDHRYRLLQIIANVCLDDHASGEAAYQWAKERIDAIIAQLRTPLPFEPMSTVQPAGEPSWRSNTTQAEYEAMVVQAKEFIHAGDVFQVVPSQRFEVDFEGGPLDLYRALRHINPSPYMFCLNFDHGFALVGSSPEIHVRSLHGKIDIRPIAGTRRRGASEAEDQALAQELLADPKERAEHIMLVDLARNDVGRVARYQTVKVSDLMTVERYSHVMHIVSNVEGTLDPAHSAYDVMRATFPAGTVSGSPKVRAMQIIHDLEKSRRGAYAGAVGYFGFDGNLDSCIALRTAVVKDGKVYVQAGAGVVADSDPTSEYQETVNKARALIRAVEHARWLASPRT